MVLPPTPPHSIEAEQSVLGGLMLDNGAFDRLVGLISADDFYIPDHRTIFEGIADLIGHDKPADFVTLSEYFRERNRLEQAGGIVYLGTLAADTPSVANVVAYAEIVRERAILREVAQAGQNLGDLAFRPEGRPVAELLDLAEQRVFSIRQKRRIGEVACRLVKSILPEVTQRIEDLAAKKPTALGLPTGIRPLDALIKGLQPGDLVIVAARPGLGKTSLALNFAEEASISRGIATVVFSMEMTADQLVMRLISSLGRIDQEAVRSGTLSDQQWASLVQVVGKLEEAPLYIDQTPAMTISDLRGAARQLARRQPLGLIVVDYLQLMQAPGARENRNAEISEISRGLKALAKELHVPVVALSQLNRSIENREDKTPRMSDLRESGSIEQDADIILFIHRETRFTREYGELSSSEAEIVVGKHRNGPTGKVAVSFSGRFFRFEESPS